MSRIAYTKFLSMLYMIVACIGIFIQLLVNQESLKLVDGGFLNEGLYFIFFYSNLLFPPLLFISLIILLYKGVIDYKDFVKFILSTVLSFYAISNSFGCLIDL